MPDFDGAIFSPEWKEAESLRTLSKRYGINPKTIAKWKKRTSVRNSDGMQLLWDRRPRSLESSAIGTQCTQSDRVVDQAMIDIGLALGGGGAKGLAHICMLEVLDEFGIKPTSIVGTSIGAIVGALYASGMSAETLREEIENVSRAKKGGFTDAVKSIFNWSQFVEVNWKGGSLLKPDAFLDDVMKYVKVKNFEELRIPLKMVAADFWHREEVVLETGDIRTAAHASMAVPGVFEPVVADGRVLVDGGVINPVPYDLVPEDCDLTIAIDVLGSRTESAGLVPSIQESVFNSFQIMQKSILRQKIAAHPPDIYICPEIVDILMLEFYEAEKIFAQAEPAADQLRRELERHLQTVNRGP